MPRFAFRQRLVVVGPLMMLILFIGLLPPGRALAQASVTLDQSSGLPATTVHPTGSGWIPGQQVTVLWDGQPAIGAPIGGWRVSATGTFDYQPIYFLVPFTATVGLHTISVVDLPPSGSPRNSVQVSFTVTSPDSVWLGNDTFGRSVGMVVKDSYVTRIQFRSADNLDIATCDNVPISNSQFTCIPEFGVTVTGQFTSDTQAVGTYSYTGENATWIATNIYSAPQVDIAVAEVIPVQVVEGVDLVTRKDTAVKVVLLTLGGQVAENVHVTLHNATLGISKDSFYIGDSVGWDNNFIMQTPTTSLSFPASQLAKRTIYFFGDALKPLQAGSYNNIVCVEYSGDPNPNNDCNNSNQSIHVRDTKWGKERPDSLDIAYVPVDLPKDKVSLFKDFSSASTTFIEKTYPISAIDVAANVSSNIYHTPLICTVASNPLILRQLACVILNIEKRGKLANPNADRIVGIFPDEQWFNRTFPFDSLARGVREGLFWPNTSTSLVRLNATVSGVAHELGHSFGILCEEYSTNCYNDPNWEPPTSGTKSRGATVKGGIDVSVHRLMNDGDVKQNITHKVYNFMGDGEYNPPNPDRWVSNFTYQDLLNRASASSISAHVQNQTSTLQKILLVSGSVSIDGKIDLSSWYVLPEGEADILENGPYSLQIQDVNGQVLSTQSFDVQFHVSDLGIDVAETPFVFSIPYPEGARKITIYHGNQVLATRQISPNAPVVTIESPQAGNSFSGKIPVRWHANDADGDVLFYTVLVSNDSGVNWSTASLDLLDTSLDLNTSDLSSGSNYRIKIMATDGVNTGEIVSGPFNIQKNIYIPLVIR